MTATYDLLASNVLSTATASVTFDSIPTTGYRDLVLVFHGSATTASEANIEFRFNGISTTSYFGQTAEVDKVNNITSATYSNTRFFESVNDGNLSNSGPNATILQIFDYAENKHKICLMRTNNTVFLGVAMQLCRFANTAAISSITLTAGGTSFAIGSAFTLFGIVA